MKKIICLIFTFLVITLNLGLIENEVYSAANIQSFNPKYGVTNANVNFRSVATTNSNVIRKLAKGTALKMIGNINGFYIVQLSSNEIGFVYSDYVNSSSSAPSGASTYTNIGNTNATINTSSVNFRRGPGTSFSSIQKFAKGTNVTVIGKISGWYVCVTANNIVGCVYSPYLNISGTYNNSNTAGTSESNIELVLRLINEARSKAGVSPLKLGATLPKIAQLKADDMVKNNYFSHTSKTYGTPFEMMEDYNIDYNTAGENIAGNPDITAAVNSWLASDTHKQNLLSSSYEYIGIGIAKSSTYGYIIVAMFVG